MPSKEQIHSDDKATTKPRSSRREAQNFEKLTKETHPATIIRGARVAPSSLTSRDVLQLQCTIGNQAVSQLLAGTETGRPTVQRASGGGQPLEEAVQNQVSETVDHDSGGVRVQTGLESDPVNQQLMAKAFTTGPDIFFKRRAYDSSSSSGRELIVHELSHLVQQSTGQVTGRGNGMTVRPDRDALEKEADTLSGAAVIVRQVANHSETDSEGPNIHRRMGEGGVSLNSLSKLTHPIPFQLAKQQKSLAVRPAMIPQMQRLFGNRAVQPKSHTDDKSPTQDPTAAHPNGKAHSTNPLLSHTVYHESQRHDIVQRKIIIGGKETETFNLPKLLAEKKASEHLRKAMQLNAVEAKIEVPDIETFIDNLKKGEYDEILKQEVKRVEKQAAEKEYEVIPEAEKEEEITPSDRRRVGILFELMKREEGPPLPKGSQKIYATVEKYGPEGAKHTMRLFTFFYRNAGYTGLYLQKALMLNRPNLRYLATLLADEFRTNVLDNTTIGLCLTQQGLQKTFHEGINAVEEVTANYNKRQLREYIEFNLDNPEKSYDRRVHVARQGLRPWKAKEAHKRRWATDLYMRYQKEAPKQIYAKLMKWKGKHPSQAEFTEVVMETQEDPNIPEVQKLSPENIPAYYQECRREFKK